MRSPFWARWAACALALSICVPAFAKSKSRAVTDCASFDQADKGDDAIEFTIHNSCSVPVDCSISWRVVCVSKKHRAVHPGSAKLALVEGTHQQAEASAAICGEASWSIDEVSWRCEPNEKE